MARVQDQVQDQDERARRVAEGPAARGDRVPLVRLRDLRQIGVVEHHRHREGGVRHDQQERAEEIPVARQEEHAGGRRGPHIGRGREQRLLPARTVRDRTHQGHHQNRDHDRGGHGVREERAYPHRYPEGVHEALGVGGRPCHRGQIGAEEHGDDARRVHGAGEVVEVPAPLLTLARDRIGRVLLRLGGFSGQGRAPSLVPVIRPGDPGPVPPGRALRPTRPERSAPSAASPVDRS